MNITSRTFDQPIETRGQEETRVTIKDNYVAGKFDVIKIKADVSYQKNSTCPTVTKVVEFNN